MSPDANSRRWELDALRGLMLVLMTVTHLPTRLSDPLGQPFGYVSAAEGFVLLSGTMAGWVYGRLALREGIAAMRRAFWRRALLVYACHAALLLFLFTVIAFVGLKVEQPAVTNLMSYYLREPVSALWGGLFLIYQPPLLDILPLYVLLMLGSPWALALALRVGWAPVLAGSGTLWLLAQFGMAQWLHAAVSAWVPLPVPYGETGAFNFFAWQLVWMLGLWLGAGRMQRPAGPWRAPGWALVLATSVALAGFTWRHLVGQEAFPGQPGLNLLMDKWLLGPLRMANLLALLLLVLHAGPALAARIPRLRWLETLGAASLTVFCAHLVLVLGVLSVLGHNYDRPWWQDTLLLAASLAVLHAVAQVSLRVGSGGRRPPAPLTAASR